MLTRRRVRGMDDFGDVSLIRVVEGRVDPSPTGFQPRRETDGWLATAARAEVHCRHFDPAVDCNGTA